MSWARLATQLTHCRGPMEGAISNGIVRRTAYRTTTMLRRNSMPQLPDVCKRRVCVPLLDMLSGSQNPWLLLQKSLPSPVARYEGRGPRKLVYAT